MGRLEEGTPLSWNEVRINSEHVREQGVRQFIVLYKSHESRRGDPFLFGDEVSTYCTLLQNHMLLLTD